MEMIVEYACEQCGGSLMKPAITPLDPYQLNAPASRCGDCGHVTPVPKMARLQWTAELRSTIDRVCTVEERKKLRLDPATFVEGALNVKLIAAGRSEVEIDLASKPVENRERRIRE